MNNIKILDCTLRDGGYYNNWDFNSDLVNNYLNVMSKLGIDYVEIGLRSNINTKFQGPFAYCTDQFLDTLEIPKNIKLGVMINASELLSQNVFDLKKLNKLVSKNEKHSRFKLIRIASHYHEFEEACNAIAILKKLGYEVGINIMQIAQLTKHEVVNISKLSNKNKPDILYFADSLGSMLPDDIIKIIKELRTFWFGDIGIHTHDNMSLSFSNSIAAINQGVNWIDATVTGMGRGPGNLRTEDILSYLTDKINIDSLVYLADLIENYFEPLKLKHKWGTNIFYFLTGKLGIHPTYMQKILADERYNNNDLINILDQLKDVDSKKYDKNTIINTTNNESFGTWKPYDSFKNKTVLIIGTGPSIQRHNEAIINFIESKKPIVLALNKQDNINKKYINYYIACNPIRMLADIEYYRNKDISLITPLFTISNKLIKKLDKAIIRDFGLKIDKSKFVFNENHCVVPYQMAVCYALSIANSGKASNIYMVGFDGYRDGDLRNNQMNEIIGLYHDNPNSLKLTTLTQTKYNLDSKSIYGNLNI